ncbi:competence protein CoiA family protein [Streptomyces sp. NPDC004542]|uniref:competence protein CoiA family protein n=1 Tax=Streptomyces sp. NPDC004542 TaxID=3154281 RepID=UPI0033A66FC5
MPFTEEDTRKVQTAVSGHVGSDLPVFLPMDADDFASFMRLHPERSFFCGTLLGGCGRKLAPKQYRDRKCHFAHVAGAVDCRRTDGDEAGADHLYIGRALADWLKRQKQRAAQPAYKPKGHQVRDVVDVAYDTGRLIRVQLARRSKREWETSDAELRVRRPQLDWIFGPDSLLANWQVDRTGYALRVQCRSLGATRIVEIGTQFPDRPVKWVPLAQCTLSPQGIVTPELLHTPNGIVPRHAVPAGLPLTPASVLIGGARQSRTTDTHRFFEVSLRVDARLSLPAHAPPPDAEAAYLPTGATLSVDDDGTWLIHAEALHRLQPETSAGQRTDGSRLPSDADLVRSFRETLENAARSGNVVTVSTLCRRASLPGHGLPAERWRELLVRAEQPRTPGKPVLSALIKGRHGGPAPFFGEVLRGLGRPGPFSDAEVAGIWDRERARAHAAYSRDAEANSPSLPVHETRPRPSEGGQRTDPAATRRRAAFDALLDLAHEAQQAGDLVAFERNLHLAERAAWSAETHELVRGLTAGLVDRLAEEFHDTWERLSVLVDRLNREGDDLLPDQLGRALRGAERLAAELGEELAEEERRDIARWRRHLTRITERPTLSELRRHAVAVRLALRRAAREGRTTTWGELSLRIGAPLSALHPDDKVAVLVEADRDTPAGRPLLSALVTAHGSDRPHPLYRQVLCHLDRTTPPPEALLMHWRTALRRHQELR